MIRNLPTMAAVLAVFALALVFASSSDWRDNVLAYIVIIVYILIGAYHARRLAKSNQP